MKLFFPFSRENKNENKKTQQRTKKPDPLFPNITDNIDKLKDIFNYPANKDFVIRKINVKYLNSQGVLVYIEPMVKDEKVEKYIINPLMVFESKEIKKTDLNDLMTEVLQTAKVEKLWDFNMIVKGINEGKTILFVKGYKDAISLDTIGYEHRNVEQTRVENVIKGPKEAFTDSHRVNRSLIRKLVKNENLINENINIGEKSECTVSIMYISDIADPKLVEKVRKKVSEIQVDGMVTVAQLEQHIEERPYSIVPTVLLTERPDRAAAFLHEGHVVLVSTTPGCLIVPVTFWSFFHTAEEIYQRWAYGNFIRIVRLLSFLIALLLPAFYIALGNYHLEMVPTDLLLSIAATRELVPFPIFIEIIIMEVSFELIREAGARVPTTLGPTISIVGALILGQAAVQAGIISPILIIIVALTGLSSFAIPENSTNYMIRISRFGYLLAAALIGFYGLALLIVISIGYLVSIKSFGVPFFSPLVPHFKSSRDMVIRSPLKKQWLRPHNISPQDPVRKNNPKEDK